jgi:hypothetical protein
MSNSEPRDSRALSRLVELVRRSAEAPTQGELDRGLVGLRARLAASRSPWIGARAAVALAVSGLVLALAVAWGVRRSQPEPEKPVALSRIEGGRVMQGGYLSESGGQGIRLFFDDGSQCALTPGGRGRLRFVARPPCRSRPPRSRAGPWNRARF